MKTMKLGGMANHRTLSCVNHLQNNTYYNTRDIIHAPDKFMIPDAGFIPDTFTPDTRTPMQLPPIHPRDIQHKPSSEFAIKRQREELRLVLFLRGEALRKRRNAVFFDYAMSGLARVCASRCLMQYYSSIVSQKYCTTTTLRLHYDNTTLLMFVAAISSTPEFDLPSWVGLC